MARNSRFGSGNDSSSSSNQSDSKSTSPDYSNQSDSKSTSSYDNQSGSTEYANQNTYSNARDSQSASQETGASNPQDSGQSTSSQESNPSSGNQNSGNQGSGNSGGRESQGSGGPPADSSPQGGGDGEAGFFESAGEFAGQAYGTVLGGGAGSLAGPAGTVGGGMLGGMAGGEVGSAVGEQVDDAVGWVGDTISDAGSWLEDNAGTIVDGALKVANPIGAAIFEEVTDGGFSEMQDRQQAAEERAANYDKAKETLQSGGPVNLSDELLDPARQGLDLFEKFLPLYQEWNGSGPEFEAKVVKEYDQLREIDFGAFRTDAERLASIKDKLHEQNESMDHAFRGTKETWKGEASEAASGKARTYNQAGASVIQDTEAFAGAIGPVTDSIEEAVRAYAEFVLDLGAELKCAGKTPEETKDEIRKANGDINPEDLGDIGIDDIFSGAWSVIKGAAIGVICGGPIGGLIGQFAGATDAAGDIRQGLIDDAKKWLDEAFVPEMQTKYGQFQEQSGSAQDVVQSAYDKMLEAAEVQEDPFQGMQDGEGDSSQSSSPANSTPTAQPAAAATGGGGGTGGGGTGGGGMPETPETPEAPAAPEPPQAEMSGGPGAEGEQGQPEEVTLGEGDDAVTVQEPDEQGTTQVTVVGEDGQPKTYDVSFGPEQAPGEPGAGPGGQPMPGQPGAGMPAAAGGQPGLGEPEATPIQADEDGKAIIKEGDRTITLEQGPDGGVKVDIDNGQGEPPMNQTINFGDDEAAEPPPGGGIGEPAPVPDPGGGIDEPAPAPEPPMGGGIGEPVPGIPPQVGGFDAQPAADAPGGMAAEATVTASAGAGFAGDTGTAPTDAPAATAPQSAGMTSMSGLGEGAQNSFGSTSGQLLGLDEQDPAGGPEQQNSGQRGASGMASMGDSAAEGEPQGASGMASMGDSGAQSGQGAGQGAAGGGMMGGMGAMGGAQQQGGDQERSNDSPWRTQGQLFDDGIEASNVRFRSVLGEDHGR